MDLKQRNLIQLFKKFKNRNKLFPYTNNVKKKIESVNRKISTNIVRRQQNNKTKR